MAGNVYDTIDKISDAINNMRKCLECTICLQTISTPVRTRCGHSFCHPCITKALSRKNATCPLCNKSLNRRSISKDAHLELCIKQLENLILAIRKDTGSDILLHTKKRTDTKESCSYTNIRQPTEPNTCNIKNSTQQDASKAKAKTKEIKKPVLEENNPSPSKLLSLNNMTMIPVDNIEVCDEIVEDTEGRMISKVQTWLRNVPEDQPISDDNTNECDTIRSSESVDDTMIDSVSQRYNASSDNETNKEENDDTTKPRSYERDDKAATRNVSVKKRRSFEQPPRENNRGAKNKGGKTRRSYGARNERDLPENPALKYSGIHARVRAKSTMNRDETVLDDEEKPGRGIDSQFFDNHEHESEFSRATKDWSRVVQLGKEMRPKRRKLKSLDVSIEGKHSKIPEDVTRQEQVKSRLLSGIRRRSTASKNVESEKLDTNVEVSMKENPASNVKVITPSKELNKSEKNTSMESSTPIKCSTSFITLDEGEKIEIRKLCSDQMNDIIGISHTNKDKRESENDHLLLRNNRINSENFDESNSRNLSDDKNKREKDSRIRNDRNDGNDQIDQNDRNYQIDRNDQNDRSDEINRNDQNNRSDRNDESLAESDKTLIISPSQTGRLSLKKSGGKSHEKITSNASRLSGVKRDLSEQFHASTTKSLDKSRLSRLSSASSKMSKLSLKKSVNNECEKQTDSIEARYNELLKEKQLSLQNAQVKNDGRCLVQFKKLGKIFKERRRVAKFFYFGCTKRREVTKAIEGTSTTKNRKVVGSIDDSSGEFSRANSSGKLCNAGSSAKEISINTASVVSNKAGSVTSCNEKRDTMSNASSVNLDNRSTREKERESRNETLAISQRNDSNLPAKTAIRNEGQEENHNHETNISKVGNGLPMSLSTIYVTLNDNTNVRQQSQRKDSPAKLSLAEKSNSTRTRNFSDSRVTDTNSAKLLPSDKDSQLKFLTNKSALNDEFEKWTNLSGPSKEIEILSPKKTGDCSRLKVARSDTYVSECTKTLRVNRDHDTSSNIERKRKRSLSPTTTRDSNETKRKFQSIKENMRSESRSEAGNSASNIRIDTANDRVNNEKGSGPSVILRKKSNPEIRKRSCLSNSEETDFVCLSSESDSTEKKNPKEQSLSTKKKYKRLVPVSSSDTESEDIQNYANAKNRTIDRQPSKRKRSSSKNVSDNDDDVSQIVNNWCSELNTTQKSLKKSKEHDDTLRRSRRDTVASSIISTSRQLRDSYDSSKAKPTLHTKEAAIVDVDMFDSNMSVPDDMSHLEMQARKSLDEKERMKEANDRYNNEIIDRVRQMRVEGLSNTTNNANKGTDIEMMQDNFDEVIANVDSLDFQFSEDIIPPSNEETAKKTLQKQSIKPDTVLVSRSDKEEQDIVMLQENGRKNSERSTCSEVVGRSDNSDKENDQKRRAKEARINGEDEDFVYETTLLPEEFDARAKRNDGRDYVLQNKRQSLNVVGEKSSQDNLSKKTGMRLTPEPLNYNEKLDDSSYQDSLMNATRDQMLMEEFEKNLFNIKRSPRKDTNAKKSGSDRISGIAEFTTPVKHQQEAENSAEEDDIVESTPDTKVKSGTQKGLNPRRNFDSASTLKLNKSNMSTPISKAKLGVLERTSTSFSVQKTGRSSTASAPNTDRTTTTTPLSKVGTSSILSTPLHTPFDNKKMYPLHQSTPKVSDTRISSYERAGTSSSARIHETTIERSRDPMRRTRQEENEKRLCFVCSGLMPSEIERVRNLARFINAKFLEHFTLEVTHVIVKADEETNAANKTLKYLQGIAHGRWIVSFRWVLESLKEQRLVKEEPYEAVDYTTLETGPRNSRLRERGLFENFAFLCIEPFHDVSIQQYQDLLLATGGTVVESFDALVQQKKKLKVIVIQADIYDDKIIEWHRKTGAVPIVHDWLVECISRYRLVSLYPHLQELLPEDVLKAGFPKELIEEEEYAEDDSNISQ